MAVFRENQRDRRKTSKFLSQRQEEMISRRRD